MLTTDRSDIFQEIISGNRNGSYLGNTTESKISGLEYHYVIPKKLITKNNRILLWSVLLMEIEGIHEFNTKFTALEQELMYFGID